jgi:hypothetical protein
MDTVDCVEVEVDADAPLPSRTTFGSDCVCFVVTVIDIFCSSLACFSQRKGYQYRYVALSYG